jgi:RNA polymerase sigma-70 factor (ECF subfamily)
MRQRPRATEQRRADFDRLYQDHSREVWAVAYARRLDADAALDVMQETFLRLWRQGELGEAIHAPRAWLLRVARNLAEDQAKCAFRRNGTSAQEMLNGLHSVELTPPDALTRAETLGQVRDLLNELAEGDREILTLRYALDYETAAIAEVLEINVTAVHMRLSRARQRLAERLLAHGVPTTP